MTATDPATGTPRAAEPTRRPARRSRVLVPALAVLGVCLPFSSACTSSSSTDNVAALPACHAAQAAVLPHTAGSLTQADTGSYCLRIGQTLDVFLTAPGSPGTAVVRWSQIKIGDTSVLDYGNNAVMTPPVDVTPGVVVGVARGSSTLISTLPDGETWTATVVVS